ncbi:hypothetical protein FOA52_008513 [Chlamydomonas sp. UWO 241]|nr:hypothetical protein FOA52_008513 [Chlamydomonas sp. UWO 241]
MEPIRMLREATHFRKARTPEGDVVWEACSPSEPGSEEHNLQWFADNNLAGQVLPPKITMRDFSKVLLRARPTVSQDDLAVFVKFTEEFGEEAQ